MSTKATVKPTSIVIGTKYIINQQERCLGLVQVCRQENRAKVRESLFSVFRLLFYI